MLGRESNLLLAENLKMTYNTWQSNLGSLNVLLIGGTGEGKSRTVIKPNVYSLPVDPRDGKPVSMVFTDPKGELCRDTAGVLESVGYKIKVFNLDDMRHSDCYNPFKYIIGEDSLMITVDALVDNSNNGATPTDPHWGDMAKALLNSICYYVYYQCPFREQTFTNVSELLNQNKASEQDNFKSVYDRLIDDLEENSFMKSQHPAVVWRKKVSARGAELSSIISTAQRAVRLFASKDVQRLTATDTLELELLGDRPTALYIITPTTNSTYSFLVSTLYTQLFETLFYRAQHVYNGSLPHHVTFFQDEFANVGRIPDYDKKIATWRSVNLSSFITVQSPNQIKSVYEQKAQDIIDNTHITIFLGSGGIGQDSAANWMSEALGNTTIQSEKISEDRDRANVALFNKLNASYDPSQRKLMEADEIRRLPSDECLILIKGYPPIRDKKINLDRCLNYNDNHFTEPGRAGTRRLRKEYLYTLQERKATSENYRKGMREAYLVDQEQQERIEDMLREDAKYDLSYEEPVLSPCSEEEISKLDPDHLRVEFACEGSEEEEDDIMKLIDRKS